MTHLIPRRTKHLFLWTIICLIVSALFILPIANQSWAAVELRYFRTSITSSLQAELEWATEVEDTAGFIVKRAESGGSIETISVLHNGSTVSFIPATGGILGSDYQAIDETAEAGKTYTYYLFEVENNNEQVEVASDTLTIEEESTSSSLTGNTSTSSNQNDSATATPQPTATSTPVPTTQSSTSSTTTSSTSSNSGSSTSASPTPRPTITRTDNGTTVTSAATSTTTPTETTAETENDSEETAVSTDNTAVQEENSGNIEIGSVAIAQASEQDSVEQQDDEYPEPNVESVATDEAYVAPTAVPTLPPTNEGGSVQIGANATVDSEDQNENETSSEPSATSANNQLILWGSFLGALLVFISGILGAIILFRRRQQE